MIKPETTTTMWFEGHKEIQWHRKEYWGHRPQPERCSTKTSPRIPETWFISTSLTNLSSANPWTASMPHLNVTALLSNLTNRPESGNLYRPFSVFSVLTLTLLAMLVVATFVWNLLVLVTILRVRTFHRVPHNLVASMAISDVMVAGLVMPLSLVRELYGRRWILGKALCQVWISCDVLCCTASIWNVTAIALDRYWSITRHLEYTLKTRKRISNVMIGLTWLLSSVISLSPLFGWGETYSEEDLACQVSQEPSYTVFSTFGAFYLPLCVVLFVYWKIYKAAKFRIGSRKTNTIMPMAEITEVRRKRGCCAAYISLYLYFIHFLTNYHKNNFNKTLNSVRI